jgi:hypothetical protein
MILSDDGFACDDVSTQPDRYSGRKITSSLGYVTLRGEGKMEMARESKMAKSLSEHVYCN